MPKEMQKAVDAFMRLPVDEQAILDGCACTLSAICGGYLEAFEVILKMGVCLNGENPALFSECYDDRYFA